MPTHSSQFLIHRFLTELHALDPEYLSEHYTSSIGGGYSLTQHNIRELDHKLTLTSPNSDEPTLETLSMNGNETPVLYKIVQVAALHSHSILSYEVKQ